MSKPELTPEIEDVLSSIRRLVSGNPGNPAPTAPISVLDKAASTHDSALEDTEAVEAPMHENAPEEPNFDALILSPALRLDEDGDQAEIAEPVKTDEKVLWSRVGQTLQDTSGEFEADEPQSIRDWEADAAAEHARLNPDEAEPAIPAFVRALQAHGISSSPEEKERLAALRGPEPEEILDQEMSAAPAAPMSPWPPEPAAVGAHSMAEAPAAAFAHAAPTQDTPEPSDEFEDVATAFVTQHVTKEVAQSVTQDLSQAIEHSLPATDQPETVPATQEPLDMSALRDAVAEIVREELQGALGERITRNVRKLVRREIQRALTSRDFS